MSNLIIIKVTIHFSLACLGWYLRRYGVSVSSVGPLLKSQARISNFKLTSLFLCIGVSSDCMFKQRVNVSKQSKKMGKLVRDLEDHSFSTGDNILRILCNGFAYRVYTDSSSNILNIWLNSMTIRIRHCSQEKPLGNFPFISWNHIISLLNINRDAELSLYQGTV